MADNTTVQAQVNQVLEAIGKQMESYKFHMEILAIIEPVLKTFEGKKITKRIETAIQAALPTYTLYYGHPYSWYTLQLWNKNINFDQRINLNLGYDDIFSMEAFIKSNQCYYLDAERYTELKEYIDHPALIEVLVRNQNSIKESLKMYESLIPDVYPINKFFRL